MGKMAITVVVATVGGYGGGYDEGDGGGNGYPEDCCAESEFFNANLTRALSDLPNKRLQMVLILCGSR